MTRAQTKERIEKLKKTINHYRYLYHVENKSPISPDALDTLKKELYDLEQKFPEFITPDSPTQRVEGKVLKAFAKVRHETAMLSFNDAFSQEDVSDWLTRNKKLLPGEHFDFYAELKLDGLAVTLIYKNGIFETGATRGDGRIGEDVTQNLKTVEAIPLKLLEPEEIVKNFAKLDLKEFVYHFQRGYPKTIEVRGEVFMNKKDFNALNKERAQKGLSLYANPRNVAAGSVRQLNPKITSERRLDSYAYALATDLDQKTHEQEHLLLKAMGFKTNPNNKHLKTTEEIFEFRNHWVKRREELSFEIDGTVIIINNNNIFKKLGVVGKAPRGAIAYKFSPKEAETVIEEIKVQVGRTGTLTPVAVLRPAQVGGITITHASLHNYDEIQRLDLKIGDTVIVQRAGDVIPQVTKVLKELRTGKEKEFRMPKVCPICGSKVVKEPGEVAYRCSNKNCFAMMRERIYHFISRPAFDMKGLGPKLIDKFIDEGLIRDAADLFFLKKEDLMELDRFGEKLSQNTFNTIQGKKKVNLPRFINALGILHVGEETARDVAEKITEGGKIETSKDLLSAAGKIKKEGWSSIPNIGPKVSESLFDWFNNERNKKFLLKLDKAGIKLEKEAHGQRPLKGLTFVFTGELSQFSRERAQEKVRALGAKAANSISKEVDYVVVGENPGSKFDKAQKLALKIIDERQFIQLIQK